nr:ATP-binding protein [uncultured Pseudomonas sp.]
MRYLSSVLVVIGCAVARAQLPATALPYLFFIPGLMFVGFWFGVGPAVLGCILAVLTAQYFFIGPIGFDADWTAWTNSLSFGLVTLGMAVVCALFRRSIRALDLLNQNLENEVERRTDERDDIWKLSPDLICTLSAQGEVLAMNPAWQAETGWTELQLREGAFYSYISPAQLSDAVRNLHDRQIAELDTQSVRSNGQPLLLNWRITGRQGRFFAVARDVTLYRERQLAFDQVRSQLQQSQKMESLGQLTGGLAHDFNNLLTIISGSQDMIEQRLAQGRLADIDRYVGLARGATQRASSLTHRLLAYARKQPLVAATVDPALLVQDMKELIARTLTPLIDIELLAPGVRTLCHCDAHQLENALLNLCINARDAMPQGGRLRIEVGTLEVTSDNGDLGLQAGDYVRICVADTGMGMPASIVERALEPLFTTKPLGSGTGLGLSMVEDFARQAGGAVRIESELGKGTAVCLFLPVYQGSAPVANTPQAALQVAAAQGSRGAAMVIDDEAGIRELVGEALLESGFDVAEMPSAEHVVQRIAELPDLKLIVTDLILPGGSSGHKIAEAAWAVQPALKVLFISGCVDTATDSPERPNQSRLLVKPFTIEQLRASVEQLLKPSAGA